MTGNNRARPPSTVEVQPHHMSADSISHQQAWHKVGGAASDTLCSAILQGLYDFVDGGLARFSPIAKNEHRQVITMPQHHTMPMQAAEEMPTSMIHHGGKALAVDSKCNSGTVFSLVFP
ncbi:uncharacterized protein ACHE_31379S [Aspergillus chevalieri]|uniref:Uncharacterized protein n=1 Tax=Aspergillus chevalieri TaxID=182096 RepID=A0A7R7ZNL0_ASPCH|nr:uncharacterized protein ACHE_31379S [Aspergillus chevalieri]BCR87392.1 hypothetical protein ACHE_31379S [Aspergillus chevalieri]